MHSVTAGCEEEVSPHIVVGGGVAGVSCALELAQRCPEQCVVLLTASPTVHCAQPVLATQPQAPCTSN